MKKNYQIIVIGAGSVGLPTTYFLSNKGYQVLCIDKNKSVGQGENKSAIGGVRATHSDPAKIKICQKSLQIFSNLENEQNGSVGLKRGGYCFPVYRSKEEEILKGMLPIQKEFDLNINWHDSKYITEIIPGINQEGLLGGTYSPDDGQASPLLTAETFYKETKKQNGVFHFDEQVVDIIVEGNKIKGLKTNKETYYCEKLVMASGARAREVGKMVGLDLPVFPDSHEAGISAPVAPFLAPLIVDLRPGNEGKTANFYFGQNHEQALIFCYTPSTLIQGHNRDSTSQFMPIIANRLVSLIPKLKDLRIRRVWRGLYPMTPDGRPICGKVKEIEGLYLAVGMCGQGFMMGPGLGYNLASLIDSGEPQIDPLIFKTISPDRDFYKSCAESLK